MNIRMATAEDLEAIVAIEQICFKETEAATREQLEERFRVYGNHFYVLTNEENQAIGFIDGMVTEEANLMDEMYADTRYHKEHGPWQMIFGLNILPDYREVGWGEELTRFFLEQARREGRTGVVLTCKAPLIHYYAKMGFNNEGISKSNHGNEIWYQMRLRFLNYN